MIWVRGGPDKALVIVPRRTVTALRSAVTVLRATVASPGCSVASPGDSVASPGCSVASPGDSVASPGDSVASPGDSVASLGDSVASPGCSVASPGDSVTVPGQSVRVLRRTVSGKILGSRCLIWSGMNASLLFTGDTKLPAEPHLECKLLDLVGSFFCFEGLPGFRIHIDKEAWGYFAPKFGDVLQTDRFEFW